MKNRSTVWHCDPTGRMERSLVDKVSDLFDRAGGGEIFKKGDSTAVKFHCGEEGNTSYLNPAFARLLLKKLKSLGAKPFLIDTNTLYHGQRHNTADHLATARRHGYGAEEIGAPVIISSDFAEVAGAGRRMKLAREFVQADSLLVITHVTGHVLFGYAGAVKNVAMGLSSPADKQVIHSDLKPKVKQERCTVCGTCVAACPVGAITLEAGSKAWVNPRICIGCGECIAACPEKAIPPIWKSETRKLARKNAQVAAAALEGKMERMLCFNFLLDVVPDCDCCSWSDPPFVPNLGVLASRDILAVEQASLDLIENAPLLPGSPAVGRFLKESGTEKEEEGVTLPRIGDKFGALFQVEVEPFQAEMERAGLGSRGYRLVKVN